MDLKKLKIDQLRKMVRRDRTVQSWVEERHVQVNRAKKIELIQALEACCTTSRIMELGTLTQPSEAPQPLKVGETRVVTKKSGVFQSNVNVGDVFQVIPNDDICFYDKDKGWPGKYKGTWCISGEPTRQAVAASSEPVTGWLTKYPAYVIKLMLEVEQINHDYEKLLKKDSLASAFTWDTTKQGHKFWSNIDYGDFSEAEKLALANEDAEPEKEEIVFKKGMAVSFKVELNEGTKVDGVYVNSDMEELSKDESAVYIINYCKESSSGSWLLTFKGVDTSSWHYHESWFKIVGDWEETSDKRPPIGSRVEMIEHRDLLEVGDKGTVVGYYKGNDGTIYVEWDVYHRSMHDCDGLAKDGHGWNVGYDQVEVIKEEQKQETKQQSKTEEKMNTEKSQMKLDLGIDLNSILTTSIEQAIGSKGDKLIIEQIAPLVKKEVAKLKPTIVKVPENKDVKIEGKTHNKFKDILFLAQTERQVFLAGPSGSGKTFACSQVAEALSLPFSHISCSPGMSEAHLLGRMLFDGTYVAADFVTMYENGGVFLFDEIDAADAGTLLVINSALANGHMSVPNRKDKPIARRHKDFVCICAGNTWGNGSIEYAGRNYMDAAFMDRFAGSKVMVDYDQDLERDICSQLGDEQGLEVFEKITNLRQACFDKKVRRVVSTRAFISAVRQIEAGKKFKNFMKDFTIDWSSEEKSKVKA